MEGLHHRDTDAPRRIVDRRRDNRERVVHVHHRRPLTAQDIPQLSIGVTVPDCLAPQRQSGEIAYAVVPSGVPQHAMVVVFEQPRLALEDHVLTTALLVVVMDEQEFHADRLPATAAGSAGLADAAGPGAR